MEISVLIQQLSNPQLESPPQVAGLPREYLFGANRPVVMKDFFEEGLAITLRVRERLKRVTLALGCNQQEVPA
jgi:hypothetical protein